MTTHAQDGMKNHDGTWSVILPPTTGGLKAKLGCSGYSNAVRVVLTASF